MKTTLIGAAAILLGMAVVRSLLQLFGIVTHEWVLGLTALAVWWVALSLRSRPWFEKEQVDLIYYSVAILGVLIFFVQERAVRLEREVDVRIDGLQRDVESYKARLDTFHAGTLRLAQLEEDRAERRQQIITQWESVQRQVHEALVNTTITHTLAETLICAEARALPGAYAYGVREPDFPQLDAIARPEQAIRDCERVEEQLRAQREAALEQPFDLDAMLADPVQTRLIEDARVRVGGATMTLGDLPHILSDEPPATDRAAEREKIERALSTADQALDTARRNRLEDKEAARDLVWPVVWDLRYRDWPYVVIWLLSLKLARPGPPVGFWTLVSSSIARLQKPSVTSNSPR